VQIIVDQFQLLCFHEPQPAEFDQLLMIFCSTVSQAWGMSFEDDRESNVGVRVRLNSFDEWSPLREVIVGSAENYVSHERELSFDLFFHDNITENATFRTEWYYPRLSARTKSAGRVPIKQRYVDELNEDLAGIVATLESLAVTVPRPVDVDQTTVAVRTPAW
jgi:hypothetical protein